MSTHIPVRTRTRIRFAARATRGSAEARAEWQNRVGRFIQLAFLLAMVPASARAQATFLPDPSDSYFRSGAGVDVSFVGQPGCNVEPCVDFDASSSDADLFALTPAAPASLDDSVAAIGIPDIAMGSASSSGSLTITLDASQLSGGTIDLAGSLNGSISQPYVEDESLFLQAFANAPVAFSFMTTAPAWIHFSGSITKANSDPNVFSDNTSVELRLTPGNPHATFDQAGGFDLGWVPLVVGQETLILADVQLQLMVEIADDQYLGLPLMIASSVHVEFEIVPEPGTTESSVAACLVLGVLALRKTRAALGTPASRAIAG